MDRRLRLFLQGAGSVLVLMPPTTPVGRISYERQPSVAESLQGHWERVGGYFRTAIEEYRVQAPEARDQLTR
jgi:hypothetical protein